jgi:DNA-binding MarR family transcriptional regulator
MLRSVLFRPTSKSAACGAIGGKLLFLSGEPQEFMIQIPDDLHDLSHRPGFLLRKAHQVAVAIFAEEVGRLELTPPQHNVLSALMANPGSHQTKLGKMIGYDRATVGALLAGLESRGLVERNGSDEDKRLKTLTLTKKGKALLVASNAAMDRINQRILGPLAIHERPLFIALLARLAFPEPAHSPQSAPASAVVHKPLKKAATKASRSHKDSGKP